MARAIFFDTLAYAKKLEAAGVDQKQAEAQAETLAEIFEERAATKQDIDEVKKDISVLEVKINTIDTKMNWLITLIAVVGLALTFASYMHH
jgi:uncharacterized protein YpuA (DUF1002 family)